MDIPSLFDALISDDCLHVRAGPEHIPIPISSSSWLVPIEEETRLHASSPMVEARLWVCIKGKFQLHLSHLRLSHQMSATSLVARC